MAEQNVCRDAKEGSSPYKVKNNQDYDFTIGLGDMIYADGVCGK